MKIIKALSFFQRKSENQTRNLPTLETGLRGDVTTFHMTVYFLRAPAARLRFEFWESNVAGRLGLGVALRYAMDIGMQPIETRIRRLAGLLRERLENEPRVSVVDLGRVENQCGIVSFAVAGMDPADVKQGLRSKRVYVSTSAAASTPLDAEDRSLPTVVRTMAGGKTYLNICTM